MAEIIDIYDASLRPLGEMERLKAHAEGQWHRTFHCWVVNPAHRSILFQARSETTKTHPGKLDITAAGHLVAGEQVRDGVREVQEELGIEVDSDNLRFAGERVEVSDSLSGVHNREYQSVFFLSVDMELSSYRPDPNEVAGLVELPITAALDLFSGRIDSLEVAALKVSAGGTMSTKRRLSLADFIPRIQRYYLAATIGAERLCDGHRDIGIS